MHEIVVSNTTPIINLLKIEKLEILKQLYEKIIIPFQVYKEIEDGKAKDYYCNLKSLDWIKIIELSNKEILDFVIDLDKGEAETIALAKELKADLVLIDEKLARRIASGFQLKITGTLGILLRAKEKGIINNLKETLYNLRAKGTFISEKLIQEVSEKY